MWKLNSEFFAQLEGRTEEVHRDHPVSENFSSLTACDRLIYEERYILFSSQSTKGQLPAYWSLPQANKVSSKVMFLHFCVILFTRSGGGWLPSMHHRSYDQGESASRRGSAFWWVCIQRGSAYGGCASHMAVCIQGGSISGGGQLPGMNLHPGGLHPRDLPTSGWRVGQTLLSLPTGKRVWAEASQEIRHTRGKVKRAECLLLECILVIGLNWGFGKNEVAEQTGKALYGALRVFFKILYSFSHILEEGRPSIV